MKCNDPGRFKLNCPECDKVRKDGKRGLALLAGDIFEGAEEEAAGGPLARKAFSPIYCRETASEDLRKNVKMRVLPQWRAPCFS